MERTYLNYETTLQPDAVEKMFCIPFDKLKHHPLDKELMMVLMSIMMSKNNEDFEQNIQQGLEDVRKSKSDIKIGLSILENRIEPEFKIKFGSDLKMFLLSFFESPGQAVMYGVYLAYKCKILKKEILTLNDFCVDIFPFGMPEKRDLQNLWDSIKIRVERDKGQSGSDNLLDYSVPFTSIIEM